MKDVNGELVRAVRDPDDDATRADVRGYTSFELMGEFVALAIIRALSAVVAIDDRYREWQERTRARERAGREVWNAGR
jgi:hypothetical protein